MLLGGVFNSGILATGPRGGATVTTTRRRAAEIMERVRRIEQSACHNVALADAALRFPLGHPAVASVVLGAVAPQEVRETSKASSGRSRRRSGPT